MANDVQANVGIKVTDEGTLDVAGNFERLRAKLADNNATAESAKEIWDRLSTAELDAGQQAELAAASFDIINRELDEIGNQAPFDTQIAKLEEIKAELEGAVSGFAAMGAAGTELQDKNKAALDRVTEELKQARSAYDDLGEEARDAFKRAIDSADKLDEKLESGARITQNEFNTLRRQVDQVRQSLLDTYGSIDKATPAAQAKLQALEKTFERQKVAVRELKDAQQEANTELAEGGETWTGLGDAMNKALGPAGKLQAQVLLVAAAFKEGWSMGMEFNKFIGTDMSLWDEKVKDTGSKIGAVIKSVADEATGYINLITAKVFGSKEDVEAAWREIANNAKQQGAAVAAAWNLSGQAFSDYTTLTKAGISANNAYNATEEQRAKLATLLNTANRTGAEGQKILAAATRGTNMEVAPLLANLTKEEAKLKELDAATKETTKAATDLAEAKKKVKEASELVTASLAKENEALAKHKGELADATTNAELYAAKVRNQSIDVQRLAADLEAARAKTAALTTERGAGDAETARAAAAEGELQAMYTAAETRLKTLTAQSDDYKKEQTKAAEEVKKHSDKVKELAADQVNLQQKMAATTTEQIAAIDHEQKLAEARGKTSAATQAAINDTVRMSAAQGQATITNVAATQATNDAASAVTAHKDATGKWIIENEKASDSLRVTIDAQKNWSISNTQAASTVTAVKDANGQWTISSAAAATAAQSQATAVTGVATAAQSAATATQGVATAQQAVNTAVSDSATKMADAATTVDRYATAMGKLNTMVNDFRAGLNASLADVAALENALDSLGKKADEVKGKLEAAANAGSDDK